MWEWRKSKRAWEKMDDFVSGLVFIWFQFSINKSIICGDWISTIIMTANMFAICLLRSNDTRYIAIPLYVYRKADWECVKPHAYVQPHIDFTSFAHGLVQVEKKEKEEEGVGNRTLWHTGGAWLRFFYVQYSVISNLNLFICRNPVVNF